LLASLGISGSVTRQCVCLLVIHSNRDTTTYLSHVSDEPRPRDPSAIAGGIGSKATRSFSLSVGRRDLVPGRRRKCTKILPVERCVKARQWGRRDACRMAVCLSSAVRWCRSRTGACIVRSGSRRQGHAGSSDSEQMLDAFPGPEDARM